MNKKLRLDAAGLIFIPVLFTLIGCASSRNIQVRNQDLIFDRNSVFFIAVNDSAARVKYHFGANPLNYDEYASQREKENLKLDVPMEIFRYLKLHGEKVSMGSRDAIPHGDTVIVSYKELWGWDMGDIIKALDIYMFKADAPSFFTNVKFSELTIFNSHPVAKTLVPQMLDVLFSRNRTKFMEKKSI